MLGLFMRPVMEKKKKNQWRKKQFTQKPFEPVLQNSTWQQRPGISVPRRCAVCVNSVFSPKEGAQSAVVDSVLFNNRRISSMIHGVTLPVTETRRLVPLFLSPFLGGSGGYRSFNAALVKWHHEINFLPSFPPVSQPTGPNRLFHFLSPFQFVLSHSRFVFSLLLG